MPAAAAQRSPATGRPQPRLSAQGRAAGQGKPHSARGEPAPHARPRAKCVMGIPSCLLTVALPGRCHHPRQQWRLREGKGPLPEATQPMRGRARCASSQNLSHPHSAAPCPLSPEACCWPAQACDPRPTPGPCPSQGDMLPSPGFSRVSPILNDSRVSLYPLFPLTALLSPTGIKHLWSKSLFNTPAPPAAGHSPFWCQESRRLTLTLVLNTLCTVCQARALLFHFSSPEPLLLHGLGVDPPPLGRPD